MLAVKNVQTNLRTSSFSWIKLLLRVLSLLQAILPAEWPGSYSLDDGDRFDFIVVGAGSGGGVVAARLSEVPGWRVLLVEAGGDPPPASVIPSLFATLAHTQYDWDYKAVYDKGIGQAHPQGELFMTRGKMLGGSSSNNYEIYARGVPRDYDEWNEIAPGWGWNTTLYYFKKLEGMTDPSVFQNPENSHLHSTKGPVLVSRPETNAYFQEASDFYLNALQEIGIKRVLENNGPEIVGASRPHFTFAKGRRSSTAEVYLKPARNRTNFRITKYARVTKVLIDPYTLRAYGIEVRLESGKTINVYANKEVVVSAGTINTPKILMLSGIGPRVELEKNQIEVIADLPVGHNLQDHQLASIAYTGRGLQTAVQNVLTATELDAYPVPIQCGFFNLNNSRSSKSELQPHFQIFNTRAGAAASLLIKYVCKSISNFDDPYCDSMVRANLLNELDMTQLVLLHPLSRGQITLRSNDPSDDPLIKLGFLRNKDDVRLMAEGLQFMARLVDTTNYKNVKGSIARLDVTGCGGLEWGTGEYWRCYVRNTVVSLLHPVGTCAMGPDGVVNEKLKVHGVSGLRIVDASIMPKIPSGNTNAPTMMIGERAADLIKYEYLKF